jgi:hypothetical protein
LATFALALAASQAAAAELRFEEGIARNPEARTELYREQHWIRSQAGQPVERLVLYRCPDGTAFARKRVDYRDSATAPAFTLEDRRSGYREGLRRSGAATLFVKDSGEAAERAAAITGKALVADAGFDEFIRGQWSALVAGRSLPLEFAVPSRLRSLPFSLQRRGETVINGEQAWRFELRLDSWMAVFAPKIEVAYGKQSRRLLQFQGLSNLRDDRGVDSLVARIDFETPVRPSDEAAWAAAARQPLSACRAGR